MQKEHNDAQHERDDERDVKEQKERRGGSVQNEGHAEVDAG